jgi:uncharacterized protein YraI
MKRILSRAALSLSVFVATAAVAGEGYVTTDVSLRAGPDAGYPDVAMLYAGSPVAIEGCVDGWSWCDVASGDSRGWLPANYLQHEYRGQRVLIPEYGVRIGIPVISFVFGTYWGSHYRDRSWYGNRERWSQVTPQYQSVVVHNGSHSSERSRLRTVEESRGVTQPLYQGGHSAGHSVKTEIRSPEKYANHPNVEHHTVEPRAAQQHSVAVENRGQENHANHSKQAEHNVAESRAVTPRAATVPKTLQPRVIAERKGEPKASKRGAPAKSHPERQGGKDAERH